MPERRMLLVSADYCHQKYPPVTLCPCVCCDGSCGHQDENWAVVATATVATRPVQKARGPGEG